MDFTFHRYRRCPRSILRLQSSRSSSLAIYRAGDAIETCFDEPWPMVAAPVGGVD
jgi:hypothetical protein